MSWKPMEHHSHHFSAAGRLNPGEFLSEAAFEPRVHTGQRPPEAVYSEAEPPLLYDLAQESDELTSHPDCAVEFAEIAEATHEFRDAQSPKSRIVKDPNRRLIHHGHPFGHPPSREFNFGKTLPGDTSMQENGPPKLRQASIQMFRIVRQKTFEVIQTPGMSPAMRLNRDRAPECRTAAGNPGAGISVTFAITGRAFLYVRQSVEFHSTGPETHLVLT